MSSSSLHPALKVHRHAIQCFIVDVCGRKWRRGDSRPWRWPTKSRPLLRFFLLFGASRSFDVGVSVCQLPLQSHSSPEFGLWDMIKKVKTKRQVCPVNYDEKFLKSKTRLQSSTHWSLSCLGPTIVKDLRSFRWSCVYFPTQYNVHYDNWQAGHLCWTRFVSKDSRPPLFFPTTKWHKKSLNSVTVHL